MKKIAKFTEEALNALSKKEENMKISMLDIQKYFLSLLSGQNVIGTGRVKSPASLKEKILRKSYHVKFDHGEKLIESLDDVIGVRMICLLHSEEDNVWKIIKSYFSEEMENGVSSYVNAEKNIYLEKLTLPVTQKNGHDIYKIHGFYLHEKEKYNFELQIKSLIHMLWGEIEHMLFYKNYEYIIDNSFYGSVMDSMYGNLMSIDTQLKNITQQMRWKNDHILFDELKRMLAKILYEKVNPIIESLLGCMIDLRECYDSVIEVVLHMSYYFSYQECLENVQQVVRKINEISIDKLNDDIPYYEYSVRWKRNERLEKISGIISDKSKINVYYRLFVFLVGEMCDKQGALDVIETVSDYYLRIFSYEDDLEDEELGTKRGKFIIDATDAFLLEIIERFDFYWIINNKSYLMELIQKELYLVRAIDIDEADDIAKAAALMKDILLLVTLLDKNESLNESLLKEIYEMSQNDVWNLEELRSKEYFELIQNYRADENVSRKKLTEILNCGEVGLCQKTIS